MKLLDPITLGELQLSNRVIMAPLTRCRANNPDFAPTDLHVEYYRQRASAGLIITEATVISPSAVGYLNVPGIYSDAQVEGWKKVVDAVHEQGGKIFIQLWHVGRLSHPDFHNGVLPVAPSAINPNIKLKGPNGLVESVAPHELTIAEIKSTVNDYRIAAENSIKAGFDGVEIHSSNGYLIHQFFSNCSNHRQDEYGGSNENKARFFFEVVDAIKEHFPENRIGFRLNPMMHEAQGITVDGETADTFDYVVDRANSYDLAFLHMTRQWRGFDAPNKIEDIIGHYRKIWKGTYIVNSNYDREEGNQEIESGRADAVAYGRPFISNPDLVERFKNSWPTPKPDKELFYTSGSKGYTDYPAYQP